MCVQQSPEGVEVAGMDRICRGLEPSVNLMIPTSESFCQVRIPVIFSDGEPR